MDPFRSHGDNNSLGYNTSLVQVAGVHHHLKNFWLRAQGSITNRRLFGTTNAPFTLIFDVAGL